MKTNAKVETVIKAVEKVSSTLYDGNVIFRREPQNITKNVARFTLKTKDAEGKGSIITKNGQKHPKANWQVHQDVIKEIFELEPKANIYVDSIAGRHYNENLPKRKKQAPEDNTEKKFLEALKYVFEHKDLLEKIKI